jgi:hypothetical protein
MQSGPHSNVTASLSELERKLAELERELGADHGAAAPAPAPAAPAPAPPAVAPRPVPAPSAGREPEAPIAPVASAAPRLADVRGEIADLLRIRDELESATRELVAEYDRLVSRLQGTQETVNEDAAAAPAGPGAPAEDAPTFQGALVIDAGPFTDITTLTAFEQALAAVPGAKEVHVRGFEASRALINVRLVRPVALVPLLRASLPLDVVARDATVGRLVLDVAAVDAPA